MTVPLLPLRQWAGTLKFKIVLMAMVTAVLAATGTASWMLARTQASIERLLLDSAADDRERTAALLTSKVGLLQELLKAAARRLPAGSWDDPQTMAMALEDRSAIGALFNAVFAATPDGRMLARLENGVPTNELPNVADREYFQQVMKSDQPVISAALSGKVSKAPLVIFIVPALGPDGRVQGVLAGALALQSSALFLEMRADANGSGSRDLVIDRHGRILSHPDASRVMGLAADEPGLGSTVRDWLASGSPIVTEGSARVDQGFLVSVAGIPLTDWVHVRLTPTALAFAPVAEAQATAWRAAAGVGVVAGLLAGLLAYRMTRPISRLKARADALLGEGAVAGPWPREQGEVGALALAFETVVAQRERRQAEVQAVLMQLEAVLDHAEVGIALTRNGYFELVSGQFCRLFECNNGSKTDLVGQSTRVIYGSDEALKALADRARPAFMACGAFDGELELVKRNGQPFWARMRGRAVVPGDLSQGTVWTCEDITTARAQRERLAYSATHDALTGLANRVAFEEALQQATQTAVTAPFCALFIDLDRFKQVNDLGGHAAGDQLLRQVARLLEHQVRRSDLAARLGGDEFAVLLPACPPAQALLVAEKLCAAIDAHELSWEGATYGVGASVGMVAVTGHHASAADVLRAADAACYAAKRRGRNRVEAHQPSQHGELAAV